MEFIPLALSFAGTIGQVIGGIGQARQQERDTKAEAASIAAQTAIEQRQERDKTRRILGKQQAIAAASGLDPSSGTPLEIALDSAFQGEMNALNIGYSGALRRTSKLREAKYARQSIPGIIFGGLTGGGSILGDWWSKNRGGGSGGLGPTTGGSFGGPGWEY